MILLSAIIRQFEQGFLAQYGQQLLPSQRKALAAMKVCRTKQSPRLLAGCADCDHQAYFPHSCGHRNCPHCQQHEGQQWLERQLKKQLPADYFLITFTLPQELRPLAWSHQRQLYQAMLRCSWETLKTFSQNDKALRGVPGAIAVLHTHSRRLTYHPHVHLVMPAAAVDLARRQWRTKQSKSGKSDKGKRRRPFLFKDKALAKVFRAKLLAAITEEGLSLPRAYPEKWVAHCKSVGTGDKALLYLGRYLYRGVIQEKDIIACDKGQVSYCFTNSKTGKSEARRVTGERFLWLVLQHVLPKGFRRTRNFGFLHSNSKRLILFLQYRLGVDPNRALAWIKKRPQWLCDCCGGAMVVIKTRIMPMRHPRPMVPT